MKIPVGGIGFFDSGMGGLTVLDRCQKRLANENLYYLGDNARAPYGNQPTGLVRRYVDEAFEVFQRLRVKAVVLACNTVTALCVDELRARYDFPVIGAEPAVLPAAKLGGEVFVLMTRATFDSARVRALCAKVAAEYPQARVKLYPCDGLAGAIEEHFAEPSYDFTRFLPRGSPDAVVLGCTHYVYIKNIIEKFYGCRSFDGNEGIAQRLCGRLRCELFEKKTRKNGENAVRSKKNRDGRPLLMEEAEGSGIFDHFFPSGREMEKVKNKTNECSCLKMRKSLIIRGVAPTNTIYFLGSGAEKNKHFYERMFVFQVKSGHE